MLAVDFTPFTSPSRKREMNGMLNEEQFNNGNSSVPRVIV